MKYTEEQIKEKAQKFILLKDDDDPRYNLLLMMLSISFGISQEDCINKIKLLAKE